MVALAMLLAVQATPAQAGSAGKSKISSVRSSKRSIAKRKSLRRPQSHSRTATAILNRQLAKKYPELAPILKSPTRFTKTMEARFAAQKKLTPRSPLTFDFSELGMPVARTMAGKLDKKISEHQRAITKMRDKMPKNRARLLRRRNLGKRIAERQKGIEYLKELKAELAGVGAKGKVSYQQIVELAYFYSRAVGHFDRTKINLRDRLLLPADSKIQGYKQLSIEKELAMYRGRQFSLFQNKSAYKGVERFAKPFENAFTGSGGKLGLLVIPTTLELGTDIFLRLLGHDIFILGVTDQPIAADGFVRPGGEFWMHDMRHSTSVFGKGETYLKNNRVAPAKRQKLQERMDKWNLELTKAVAQVPDKQLRSAIKLFVFNYHHDRGLPMVPSSYTGRSPGPTHMFLYRMLRISKQRRGYKNPGRTFKQAYTWLQDFWLPKLGEERALLSAR